MSLRELWLEGGIVTQREIFIRAIIDPRLAIRPTISSAGDNLVTLLNTDRLGLPPLDPTKASLLRGILPAASKTAGFKGSPSLVRARQMPSKSAGERLEMSALMK